MSRKAKTGHTAGNVLRFNRAGRTSHRQALRQAGRPGQSTPSSRTERQCIRQALDIIRAIEELMDDPRRIACLHACLTADTETLAQVHWLLNGKERREQ